MTIIVSRSKDRSFIEKTFQEFESAQIKTPQFLLANPNFAMSKSSSQERREKSVKEAGGETKKVTGKDEEEGLDL